MVKCSTNLNSDPVDMLLHCLKLGISTGVYGLMLTNLLNDVMLGEPEITKAPVGLNVIDPDYVNIMITGHQHSIFVHLQEKLRSEEVQNRAVEAEMCIRDRHWDTANIITYTNPDLRPIISRTYV